VWHAISGFLLKAHASGLSHEAVIEIMVALLGVMIAALGVLSVLVSLLFAALGIFGFQVIREEVKKSAVKTATDIAQDIAIQEFDKLRAEQQAIELITQERPKKKTTSKKDTGRKTNDAGLRGQSE